MVVQILGLCGREGTHQAGLGCIPHPAPSCSLPLLSVLLGEHPLAGPEGGAYRTLGEGTLSRRNENCIPETLPRAYWVVGGVSQAPPSSGGPSKDGDTGRHVT